jgi:hypothetical protein
MFSNVVRSKEYLCKTLYCTRKYNSKIAWCPWCLRFCRSRSWVLLWAQIQVQMCFKTTIGITGVRILGIGKTFIGKQKRWVSLFTHRTPTPISAGISTFHKGSPSAHFRAPRAPMLATTAFQSFSFCDKTNNAHYYYYYNIACSQKGFSAGNYK